jgi:hypothetical protein
MAMGEEVVGVDGGGFEGGDLVLSSPDKTAIGEICRRHRLSVDDLVKCGREGLEATKIVKVQYGEDEEVPDWSTRHKFFASFMELLGYLKGPGTTVNVGREAEAKVIEALSKEWYTSGRNN